MTAESLHKITEEQRVVFLREAATADPHKSHDYIIDLKGEIAGAKILLRYVPDELIIEMDKFDRYLKFFDGEEGNEKIAGLILEDINNELLPSWLHVGVKGRKGKIKQYIAIEDSQPIWDNKALIARLRRI